ncbi:hypothetical protein HAP41_0000030445 [Bradyrhizobium barranii subsp. apii]|uniref:Uncharacterized protein n=1 Tax=Bradyrhizobium barranii subsp. apii TaxID=2819348 RepID=A0A8T5V426_9BRAD|nr:hypothetical protein [Bradyrhizobium barranii]UPT91876.1 hypothetical protein HAP41_0000030445 [Bradyrhizobium barranii subsp. apii]UPU01093.1 hypothetical protein J4G48_0028085 [Bradyrhizobium barranii subsp. apii]
MRTVLNNTPHSARRPSPDGYSAIELIVDSLTRLKDCRSLEEMQGHRRRLVVDLKARTGFDCRSSIAQVEQDIATIEAGLKALSGPIGG